MKTQGIYDKINPKSTLFIINKMERTGSNLITYEQYRSQMKTGDIMAFSGKSHFSQLIKWATRSDYSHVGILLKVNLGGGFGESILLAESTLLTDLPNFDQQRAIRGVQMQWLSKRLEMYNGSVSWLSLKKPLEPKNQTNMEAWLRQTYNKKTPYDHTQILGASLDIFDQFNLENKEDLSTIFCSELVTKALQIAGVIDPTLNPSEMTPQDVLHFDCFHPTLIPIKS